MDHNTGRVSTVCRRPSTVTLYGACAVVADDIAQKHRRTSSFGRFGLGIFMRFGLSLGESVVGPLTELAQPNVSDGAVTVV